LQGVSNNGGTKMVENEEKEHKEIKEPEQPETLQLDLLFKAAQINTTLIWMAATMATIAAINSLTGSTVLIKAVIFMMIGLISLVMYKKRLK